MVASSAAFSLMGVAAHVVSQDVSWVIVALCRTSLAMAFAGVIAWRSGVRLVLLGPRTLWLRSIAGSVSLVLAFYALAALPVSDATALASLAPLWVAALEWPFRGKTPSPLVWLAIAVGIVGVVLLNPYTGAGRPLAVACAIGGSISTGFAMHGLHSSRSLDPRAVVVHFSAVATATLLLVAPFILDGPPRAADFSPRSVALLLAVGATATAGQILMTVAYSLGQPSKVAVAGLSLVAFASLWQAVLLGSPPSAASLAGMGLILLAAMMIVGRR